MEYTPSIHIFASSIGGGFLGGVLIGYAIKKVIKLIAIVVGLFIVGLAYLQYQQIASVNLDKVEGSITGLTGTITNSLNDNSFAALMMSNFGIPLTSSMASGFTVGFLKG
jgi:uncharacterized membrane protein (Fun14 family)